MSKTVRCMQKKRDVHIASLELVVCAVLVADLEAGLDFYERIRIRNHTGTETMWGQSFPLCVI